MTKVLQLDIVTPSREALSITCQNVYLPAEDGEMGILESHEAYVTLMGTGLVRIQKADGSQRLCVRKGFIEVNDENHITLLADEVKFDHELESENLEQRLKDIEIELQSAKDDPLIQDHLLEEKKWFEVQIELTLPSKA